MNYRLQDHRYNFIVLFLWAIPAIWVNDLLCWVNDIPSWIETNRHWLSVVALFVTAIATSALAFWQAPKIEKQLSLERRNKMNVDIEKMQKEIPEDNYKIRLLFDKANGFPITANITEPVALQHNNSFVQIWNGDGVSCNAHHKNIVGYSPLNPFNECWIYLDNCHIHLTLSKTQATRDTSHLLNDK